MSYVSADPVALVTVCAMPSPFSHVTVVPAATVSVAGLNWLPFAVQIFVAVGVHPPPPPPPQFVPVALPHDTSSSAPATPDTNDSHFDRIKNPPFVTRGDDGHRCDVLHERTRRDRGWIPRKVRNS